MNTPAHLILNLAVIRREPRRVLWAPVLIGAGAPDAPMFLFYLVQKGLLGAPERLIWSQAYFDPGWQLFFDIPNSLPLAALGWWAARRRGSAWFEVLFISVALHCLADLGLHREDAHRHFWPLSDWRFVSPISYWDPRHYGRVAGAVEAIAAVTAGLWLVARHPSAKARLAVAITLALQLAMLVLATTYWSG